MREPVYITDEIKSVVQKTPALYAGSVYTGPLYFMFGHYLEIEQRLAQLTNSVTLADKKFPLIILLTDIPVQVGAVPGFYGQASLHVIICNHTKAEYTAEERLEINFKPVLYPIRDAFLKALGRHRQFTYPGELSYVSTDRYYWGRSEKSVFNDRLDAIELTELKVNVKNALCLPSVDEVVGS